MVIVPPEASIYDGVETRFVKTAVGLYVPGFISVKKVATDTNKIEFVLRGRLYKPVSHLGDLNKSTLPNN